jgi:hypothetical protein
MPRRYRTAFLWIRKCVDFEVYAVIVIGIIVPLIDIRIPPFLGYFFCRSMYVTLSQDPCCLIEPDCTSSLYTVLIHIIIRLISGTISALFFVSTLWGGVQMIVYEVFLSLIFFKGCLMQINQLIMNTGLIRFSGIWLKHRQLQLLNQTFNNIYQVGVFAIYVTAIIFITILSGSFMLKTYRDSIIVFIFSFGVTVACYSFLGILLTFASHVCTTSDKIQISWKQNPRLMKNPISRRTRLSVRNMKIKIGSCNFIERMTPLVIISFCVEQTVTVVLLRN